MAPELVFAHIDHLFIQSPHLAGKKTIAKLPLKMRCFADIKHGTQFYLLIAYQLPKHI